MKPQTEGPLTTTPRTSAAILSPAIDLLCVGGLSIVVMVPLLASGREDLGFLKVSVLAWILALVNYSHFMASYRIIYRDREMILRHRWASIGIPLILLGYSLIALWQVSEEKPLMFALIVAISSAYLAWHYTGQAWGMMASYTHLAGGHFEKLERLLIRAGLRILLVWHLVWFVRIWYSQTNLSDPPWLNPLFQVVSAATLLAFILGAVGVSKFKSRTGQFPPARALVAWLAIFVWYGAMWRWGIAGLLLVQIAHALQYLEFPARVELNRATRIAATRAATHMATYVLLLLAASFLAVLAVPGPAMSMVSKFLGLNPNEAIATLVLTFINIHHYFTDGVAWKLSNPEVRKELFAHVKREVPAGSLTEGKARSKRKTRG